MVKIRSDKKKRRKRRGKTPISEIKRARGNFERFFGRTRVSQIKSESELAQLLKKFLKGREPTPDQFEMYRDLVQREEPPRKPKKRKRRALKRRVPKRRAPKRRVPKRGRKR